MNNYFDLVIITKNKCPLGNAGAIRQHYFAKAVSEKGKKVLVISYSQNPDNIIEFDGIYYVSPKKSNRGNVLSKSLNQIKYASRVTKLIKYLKIETNTFLVIDLLPNEFRIIKKYSKKNNIRLFHDSVEWYSSSEFKLGCLDHNYIFKNKTNKKLVDKDFKVFAISTYLQNHFLSKGIESILVPVIMDVKNMNYRFDDKTKNTTTFIYAGSPDKKDLLKAMIQALNQLVDKHSFKFEIYGANRKNLQKNCGVSKKELAVADKYAIYHGIVPVSEVREAIKNADYSLLIRNSNERYAKAGFPTKVVESMACGTPVICNLSSDLVKYLEDGKNSYIVKNESSSSLKEKLEYILKSKENKSIRVNARECALTNFDYRKYKNTIVDFLGLE